MEKAAVDEIVRCSLAGKTRIDRKEITDGQTLDELGIDSLDALDLERGLQEQIQDRRLRLFGSLAPKYAATFGNGPLNPQAPSGRKWNMAGQFMTVGELIALVQKQAALPAGGMA